MNVLCVDCAGKNNKHKEWWNLITKHECRNLVHSTFSSHYAAEVVESVISNITNYGTVEAILFVLGDIVNDDLLQDFPIDVIVFNFLTAIDLLCSYAKIENIELLITSRSKLTSSCIAGVDYYKNIFINLGRDDVTELVIADAFTEKLARKWD